MASIGGFCVGSSFIIEHQRLSGLGYCFSASLPPFLTSAAITSLQIMEQKPEIFGKLRENCVSFDSELRKLKEFELSSFAESPVKHLFLKELSEKSDAQEILTRISNKCIENNLAVVTPVYLESEVTLPRPSLRICVSASLEYEEIKAAVQTIEKCTKAVLSQIN